jgi:hypothetical protein
MVRERLTNPAEDAERFKKWGVKSLGNGSANGDQTSILDPQSKNSMQGQLTLLTHQNRLAWNQRSTARSTILTEAQVLASAGTNYVMLRDCEGGERHNLPTELAIQLELNAYLTDGRFDEKTQRLIELPHILPTVSPLQPIICNFDMEVGKHSVLESINVTTV